MTSIKNIGHLSQATRIARKLADLAEALASSAHPLHKADSELLRINALQLYEEVLQLKAETGDDQIARAAEPRQAEAAPEEIKVAMPEETAPLAVQKPEDIETPAEPHNEVVTFETPPAPSIIPETPKPAAAPEVSKQENPAREKRPPLNTIPDLFSDSTVHLADKLAAQPDNSLAARLGKSPINDLRKAIGINDKFLFINELFEGNLQQYNHAIDELDGFRSYNGAKTYLIELSVLHGWDTDSPAVHKLHELIDRKFEHV